MGRAVRDAHLHALAGRQTIEEQPRTRVRHADLCTRRLNIGAQLEGDAVGQVGGPQACFVGGGDGVVDEVVTDEMQAHALAEMRVARSRCNRGQPGMRAVVVQLQNLLDSASNTDGQNIVSDGEEVGELGAPKVIDGPSGQCAINTQPIGFNVPVFIGSTEPKRLTVGMNPSLTHLTER